jgi:PHP family Zn ribbon phosphoesterase
VVLGVKRYILNAGGSEEILPILEAQAADTTSDQSEQQKSIETEIVSVNRKIHHLIEFAESGIEMEEVKKKLSVLKKEKDRLAGQRNRIAAFQASTKMRVDWAGRIAKFFSDFERRFQQADASERKMPMSKIVNKM